VGGSGGNVVIGSLAPAVAPHPTGQNGRVSDKQALLSVAGLTKQFGPVPVLQDVDLKINRGEILVLLGPNGAGKSTLLNIICGTLQPTSGELEVNGKKIDFAYYNGLDARKIGIHRVFQELSTFPNLTVAQNLQMTSGSAGRISRKEMLRRARDRMQVFPDNRISVRTEAHSLTVAERQIVEIVRAMTEEGAHLVILDEPTSALQAEEAKQLASLVRRRAAEGVAVVYVTHKLEEAINLADRIVVLRDGRVHFDGDGRAVTHDRLLELLGAAVESHRPNREAMDWTSGHRDALTVQHLSGPRLRDISVHVGSGEIVGLAGLEGAGQRELLQSIFDARAKRSGPIRSVGDVSYVSGDRKKEGVLPLWTVEKNVGISAVPNVASFGFVDFAKLRTVTQLWLKELGLSHRADSEILHLSGGNQQRALLGRALASDAPILLLDDPTRGVDVSAKGDIYAILDKLKENHRSAILYSTEVAEFRKCDRVYVMARGRIAAEFLGSEATEQRIIQASFASEAPEEDAALKQGSSRPVAKVERINVDRPTLDRKDYAKRILQARALPAAILALAMLCLAFWLEPHTLSTFGLNLLLQASVPLAFAVLAQMLFLLGGDIDLGLGFAIGLANVIAATYLVDSPLIGGLELLALIAGYIVMALLVELIGVSSIVMTLGASFVWLGVGLMIRETPGGSAPDWLAAATHLRLWPLPLVFYFLLLAAGLGVWISQGWSYSTYLRALGNNKRTYVSLGYSALLGRVTLYALAGVLAVLSGLLITSYTRAGNINVASSYTLSTVAAVVVGGASFAGGVVSAAGAILAMIGMSLITSNLVFLGVSSEYSTAIGGLVLILVLSIRSVTQLREL
jgi:ribose transport system ATP-binding protein